MNPALNYNNIPIYSSKLTQPQFDIRTIVFSDNFIKDLCCGNLNSHKILNDNFSQIIQYSTRYALIPTPLSQCSYVNIYKSIQLINSIIQHKILSQHQIQQIITNLFNFFKTEPQKLQNTLYSSHFKRIFQVINIKFPHIMKQYLIKNDALLQNMNKYINFQGIFTCLVSLILVNILNPINYNLSFKIKILHAMHNILIENPHQISTQLILQIYKEIIIRKNSFYDAKQIVQFVIQNDKISQYLQLILLNYHSFYALQLLKQIVILKPLHPQNIKILIQFYYKSLSNPKIEHCIILQIVIYQLKYTNEAVLLSQFFTQIGLIQNLFNLYLKFPNLNILHQKINKLFDFIVEKNLNTLSFQIFKQLNNFNKNVKTYQQLKCFNFIFGFIYKYKNLMQKSLGNSIYQSQFQRLALRNYQQMLSIKLGELSLNQGAITTNYIVNRKNYNNHNQSTFKSSNETFFYENNLKYNIQSLCPIKLNFIDSQKSLENSFRFFDNNSVNVSIKLCSGQSNRPSLIFKDSQEYLRKLDQEFEQYKKKKSKSVTPTKYRPFKKNKHKLKSQRSLQQQNSFEFEQKIKIIKISKSKSNKQVNRQKTRQINIQSDKILLNILNHMKHKNIK